MKKNERPSKLLWLDLEMTGLDPASQRIIEVGAIVTDFDFNELATYETVVKQSDGVLTKADPWVLANMKELFRAVPGGKPEPEVVQDLLKIIKEHFTEPVILAGNSIHQDRRFIRQWWPEIEAKLHYRMLDVTAFKVLMHGKFNHILEQPEVHRALTDIRGSITELKHYLEQLQQPR